jgi:hypothetical protein
VRRRQVGLVRGTRWSVGSSTDRMVERMTRLSRGRFLGCATKPRSRWDFVGAKSWVVIDGGYIKFVGFAVVHQKTIGLLSWATRGRRPGVAVRSKPAWPVWRTGLTGLGRRASETSRRRTHVGIARLASRLREVRSPGIRLWVLQRQIPKLPLVGVYPSLGFRGILVFRLASI